MNWIGYIIPTLVGLVGGYAAAMLAQRLSVINTFASLIEKELSELATSSDNIGGAHGVDLWHTGSRRRVKAYARLLKDGEYLWGEEFRIAFNEYCRSDLNYVHIGREGLIERLCHVYTSAKKMS